MLRVLLLAAAIGLAAAVSPATEPFEWSISGKENIATVAVQVAPDYYLSLDSLEIAVQGADGKAAVPEPETADRLFNAEFSQRKIGAGRHQWNFRGLAPFTANVSWQGCREAAAGQPALCLAPDSVTLGGKTPLTAIETRVEDADLAFNPGRLRAKREGLMNANQFVAFLRSADHPASDAGTSPLAGRGALAIILLAIAGGAALNLTPCVLPMIPVNLAIIGADGNKGRRTGLRRGLLYGGGMAAAYGVLGLLAVFAGVRFGQLNSMPWFNFAVAAVFLVLALGMFGWFNLDFSRWKSIRASRLPGGPDAAALLAGALAALLAGACVAPVVISVLLLAAQL